MGKIVLALYKPFEGKENELLELIKEHTPLLLKHKLITSRKAIVLKSDNGTIIEIFEWRSPKAIDDAHTNEQIMNLWNKFGEICSYETLGSLEESKAIFPNFKVLDF